MLFPISSSPRYFLGQLVESYLRTPQSDRVGERSLMDFDGFQRLVEPLRKFLQEGIDVFQEYSRCVAAYVRLSYRFGPG